MPVAIIYSAAALLALGAAPLPYGYYTFLRLIGCAVFGLAAFISHQRNATILPFAYGALALPFNPIVKVHLPKEAWAAIDVSSAVFLVFTAKRIRTEPTQRSSGAPTGCHQGPVGGTRYIFANRALASCRSSTA